MTYSLYYYIKITLHNKYKIWNFFNDYLPDTYPIYCVSAESAAEQIGLPEIYEPRKNKINGTTKQQTLKHRWMCWKH